MQENARLIWLLMLTAFSAMTSLGQNSMIEKGKPQVKDKIDDYYIDFSIPDLGAFTLLNTKPDYIITPGSTKEFAASIISVVSSGYTITPGLAFDWSPGSTIIKTYSPETYRRAALFRNLQLTAGTVADSGGTRVAVGLKWTFIDNTDPLMDPSYSRKLADLNRKSRIDLGAMKSIYLNSVTEFLDSLERNYGVPTSLKLTYRVKMIINPDDSTAGKKEISKNFLRCTDSISYIFKQTGITGSLTETDRFRLYSYCEQLSRIGDMAEAYRTKSFAAFEKACKEWMDTHWNATIITFGLGWTGNSPNNKWSKLSIQTLKTYLNGQFKLGNKSQLTGMISYTLPQNGMESDSTILSQAFAGLRFLTGNARNRFSLDLGYGYSFARTSPYNKQSLNLALGGEIKLSDGMFFEIAAGLNGEPSEFFSNANIMALGGLKYALHPKPRFPMGN